ncbi:N-acetylgalactosamine 6-sulfatase (GALNS) [Lentisphaera araneosa HTCC2155]|uniref:N-acetylgalactosamine 6-sulfatase (GALNS) n=1 Tax=Lentisphaera araneosa HTCC2155 TaxID=313628 RepID=A6DI15_9BACT|nr:sulfatase-like hydrolase/transferase [Lentisphaera araneosa]EDM28669.1 N-acetylgalactosamine 6-sulfatase (GALNS) [Lentisphaera araneosa HTCC2155]
MTFKKLFLLGGLCLTTLNAVEKPNIILMMADDLGYGDVGFTGNEIIKTPELDSFVKAGVIMTHSYAGGPVCSPTRGTCLTGRHYHRYGIFSANVGHLPREEVTISEILKQQGYLTGHFGKWHLGTLSKTVSAKGPGRKPEVNFSPPWEHAYDESFVMESAVGTWDPGYGKRAKNNPFYNNGETTMEHLKGGAARVVMDRVIPFIKRAKEELKPFLAVVWFNAPHKDIIAGEKYLEMYKGHGDSAAYYACITEMDEQLGRLQRELKNLDLYENTLQFFTSDNGPKGKTPQVGDLVAGSAGSFSGRKRDLYDGGVRVPTAAVWPAKLPSASLSDIPASTLDYLPTIAGIVGAPLPEWPIDGIDIMPQLLGQVSERDKGIPMSRGSLMALVKGKYKYMTNSSDTNVNDVMYDLSSDIAEKENVLKKMPELGAQLRAEILALDKSFAASHAGKDYKNPDFVPVGKYPAIKAGNKGVIQPKNNASGLKDSKSKKNKKTKGKK